MEEAIKKVYTSNLRQFAGKTLKVITSYPAYRAGGLEINGKFVFRKFYACEPSNEEVVTAITTPTWKPEWREVVWVDKKQQYNKVKLPDDFYKTYKKVFDLEVELEEEQEIIKYKDVKDLWDIVVIQQVSSSKVKDLIDTLTDFDIPLIEGKKRDGTMGMIPEYDYEDKAKDELNWKSFTFKVVGEGLETKYTYKEKAFNKKTKAKDLFEDMPF